MPYETLVVTTEESFGLITLNRPPANAISEALMRELNAALSGFEADDGRAERDHHRGRRSHLLRRGGPRLGLRGGRRGELRALRDGRRPPDRALPQARRGRPERPRPRRRLRDRHGLPLPTPQGGGPDGTDRVEPRHHPGLRRNPAPPAPHRADEGPGVPDSRDADPRARSVWPSGSSTACARAGRPSPRPRRWRASSPGVPRWPPASSSRPSTRDWRRPSRRPSTSRFAPS